MFGFFSRDNTRDNAIRFCSGGGMSAAEHISRTFQRDVRNCLTESVMLNLAGLEAYTL